MCSASGLIELTPKKSSPDMGQDIQIISRHNSVLKTPKKQIQKPFTSLLTPFTCFCSFPWSQMKIIRFLLYDSKQFCSTIKSQRSAVLRRHIQLFSAKIYDRKPIQFLNITSLQFETPSFLRRKKITRLHYTLKKQLSNRCSQLFYHTFDSSIS